MLDKNEKYVIVPYEDMKELMQKVDEIKDSLTNSTNNKGVLGEFVPEKEAQKILSKGTTWFWNKRQTGELKGKKAGNQWYYKRSSLLKLIENGTI